MEFKLDFNMDNSMFDLNPEREVASILNDIGDAVKAGLVQGLIHDINGNKIGWWEIETE